MPDSGLRQRGSDTRKVVHAVPHRVVFGDKGLNGNFINGNGLVPYLDNKRGGGDYNYLFVETEIKF